MKPMLAEDYDESKIRFPVIAMPKIDGVRGLNFTGKLTGRSLKTHANKHVTSLFSHDAFIGFDGEFAAEHDCHPDLCRLTTSAMSRIEGEPFVLWWVFDHIVEKTRTLTYENRLFYRDRQYEQLIATADPALAQAVSQVRLVPWVKCHTLEELLHWDSKWLDDGYEGTIIRDPEGKHKDGRSTVREGGYLRIKRFVDGEAEVIELFEGQTNNNEATLNELGQTERSTHQENMVPNGMLGAMNVRVVKDIKDLSGKLLFPKGHVVKVSPGKMNHDDRTRYLKNTSELIGRIIKFQCFPKGVKDKPRFPTFQSFTDPTNI